MQSGRNVDLVLLRGGRPDGDTAPPPLASSPRSRPVLHVVPAEPREHVPDEDEMTMAAAARVRREVEERTSQALDLVLRVRAPDASPG